MVGTCANRHCGAPFLYFRAGRLFTFDLNDAPSLEGRGADQRTVEHFWLCDRCASTLTLTLERGRGVVVGPLVPNSGSLAISVAGDEEAQVRV